MLHHFWRVVQAKSIKEDEILSQLLLEVEELYGQRYKNNVAIRNNTRDDGAGSRTMPESPRVEPRLSEGRYRQGTGNNDELPNASGSNISLIDDITDFIEEETESIEAETKAEKSVERYTISGGLFKQNKEWREYMASANQEWLDFAEYYAYADEEGYDGVHNGGIKGIKEDAPEWAKKRYEKYIERLKEGFM